MISKIRDKINKKVIVQIVVITLLMVLTTANIVYAADNTYAKNLSDWIMSGVEVIALAVVGAYTIKFLMKRQMVQFISFLVLAAVILVIIFDPMRLKAIGEYLWGVVFG